MTWEEEVERFEALSTDDLIDFLARSVPSMPLGDDVRAFL
jgi:hypothetical protein